MRSNRYRRFFVSIHAPAWGATSPYLVRVFSTRRFQSTHPRGVRHVTRSRYRRHALVSIHAPVWGATPTTTLLMKTIVSFNPRTRVGCDSRAICQLFRIVRFQSTHPRGVRRCHSICCRLRYKVSIHAPAWGATTLFFLQKPVYAVFQSTHPCRGRRGCGLLQVVLIGVSIHAPVWGATSSAVAAAPSKNGFNPRTRVGCDVYRDAAKRGEDMFQSTHP